jgi:two-component system phosphate regulon sensor histidine kinase PhoR
MTGATLAALLGAVPVALLVVDEDARILGANEPAETLLGPVPGGRPFVTVLRHPEVNAALDAVLAGSVLSGSGRARLNVTLNLADHRVLCATVTVTRLDAPGLRGAAISIEDRSRDEESEQMRRDFVANVSHELRTPLTALMGFIETLRGPARNDPAARDRFLNIMEREAGRMNRLVADLLSLSRVESGRTPPPRAERRSGGLLRAEVATLSPSAAAAGVRLELGRGQQGDGARRQRPAGAGVSQPDRECGEIWRQRRRGHGALAHQPMSRCCAARHGRSPSPIRARASSPSICRA